MDKQERIKILYLDDEMNNLTGFKAHFRLDYQIFLTSDVGEAIDILAAHPDLRIVFSDQRMPGKSGTDFFEEIRGIYPLPVRVLLTAYPDDLNAVVDAINKGNVYRYVRKPWSTEAMQAVIIEANRYYLTNSILTIRNKELEQAYNELDKFAHSVSHDIRGPLTGIMSAAELALAANDLGEIKEILQIISNSAKGLDNYVFNIHDYYSTRRGEFNITEINLEELAADMKAIYGTIANAKLIDFEVFIHDSGPFRSDEVAIKLILNNLLSNAFKYQDKNAKHKFVILEMSVNEGTARFIVRDSGIGIKEAHLSEIFNLFFRASVEEEGSGLGLYNVKNVLTKLGGRIAVNSTENVGSAFIVSIPTK